MMTVTKTSRSHSFPLSSPGGQSLLGFLGAIVRLTLTGTAAQMGANQRASWDTSRGEVSSRARYLQSRVGAIRHPLLCAALTPVGLGLSLCKANNSVVIVGRACGTAYLSVGPRASTIDGSSEWGLGPWRLNAGSVFSGSWYTATTRA